jgi:hypothetical protein
MQHLFRRPPFMHHHKLKVAGMVQFNKITVMPNGMMNLPISYLTRVSKGAK